MLTDSKSIYKNLTQTEINAIYQKYSSTSYIIDEILKLRIDNIQKIQPFIKINRRKKKFNKKQNIIQYIPDPYKFKEIPNDIRIFIKNILKEYCLGHTTLAYKINVDYHIIDNFLNKNDIIDNYILYKILNFLNYDIDKKKLKEINLPINNNEKKLEDKKLHELNIEYIDINNIDMDKI